MKSPISPVVPPSIDRAKRVAKQLHEIYPQYPLSKAQEVTAKLMFWDDWHALDKAVKSSLPPGPFDSEFSESEYLVRMKEQVVILCLEMMMKDMKLRDERMLQVVREMLEQPHYRFSRALAIEAVMETAPTAEYPKTNPPIVEIFKLSPNGEWMKLMPKMLARWWKKNIPGQPEIEEALEAFQLNENLKTSLLRFGQYWGTLCTYYADAIPIELVIGTAYIVAQRFATIEVHRDENFQNFVTEKLQGINDLEKNKLMGPWHREQLNIATVFLKAYPRDDVLQIYTSDPNRVMEIGFNTHVELDKFVLT